MEDTKKDEGQSKEAEGQSKDELKAIQEQLEQMRQTNARLLEESKINKRKRQELEQTVTAKENEELEKSGKLEELLERERNEKLKLAQEINGLRKQSLKKDLNFEIAKYASDAYDVGDVINALPSNLVQIDEENMSIGGIKEAVDFLKENKPYLFKQAKSPSMVNRLPDGKPPQELSYIDAIKRATTQKELDAVRKKYGRA